MSCVNCGEKGHLAQECKKPPCDAKDRPCFICKKKGCRAGTCPERRNRARPVKAIENGGHGDSRSVPVLMIGMPPVPSPSKTIDDEGWQRPRKPATLNLGSFAVAAAKPRKTKVGVRFRALVEDDEHIFNGSCAETCCVGHDRGIESGSNDGTCVEGGNVDNLKFCTKSKV